MDSGISMTVRYMHLVPQELSSAGDIETENWSYHLFCQILAVEMIAH